MTLMIQYSPMQRWIKKKNWRVRYSRIQHEVVPAAKCAKLTTWQAHMKNFGQTSGRFAHAIVVHPFGYILPIMATEGKEIMREKGVKEFAKTASSAYKLMTKSEKERLKKKCSEEKPVTIRDVKHEGRKIFKIMDKQVPFDFGIPRPPWCMAIWDP